MVFSVEPSETFWESPSHPYEDEAVASVESYSLMFFIKLLELTNRKEDEEYTVSLHCVGGGDSVTGTLADLNTKKPGEVVSLQADKDKFVRFLKENSINVRIKPNDSTVYKGVLKLNGSKVMDFEPDVESSTPVEEQFPIHDEANEVVGKITMILQVVHNASTVDPLSNADVIYRINDSKLKSADKREAELRQLLVCTECSMPRTSNNGSGCEYEIIDGILHRKGISSTERIIEQIKEKINRAKLDETFDQRDSISNNGNDASCKFCTECGGMTITGETCKAGERPSRPRSSHKVPEDRYSAYAMENASTPSGQTKNASKNAIRCCDRCKACLDWLPTECCCPKCGYKRSNENTPLNPTLPQYFSNTSKVEPLPTGKAASLHDSDTIVASSASCQLCQICQTRCIDCANQINQQGNSRTSSSFICSFVKPKPGMEPMQTSSRPITRRPWRTGRPSHGPKSTPAKLQGSAGCKRTEEMKQVYGGKGGKECKNQPQPATNGKSRMSIGQIRKSYKANIRQIKRQNRKLYSYRFGKRHPGIVVGHRTCMRQDPLVPPHMGWQWDICPPGIGKRLPGWRPGAVRQPIRQLMQHFLKCYPLDNLPVSKKKSVGFHTDGTTQDDQKQKPTLHITKQNGVYSITMNPLKDSDTLKTTDDPYLPCKPIKFKLAKDPHRTKLYQLRDILKRKGLPLCGCKELVNCEHCTDREKRIIKEEIRRSAKVLGLPVKTSISDVPSGSESELDVEFTPPSAIIRPDAHRPDVAVAETQYNVQDFQLKPDGKDIKSKASNRGGVSNHGKGDAGSRPANALGSKAVTQKGGAVKKKDGGKAGAPDAANTKVRISVAQAKGSGAKGSEPAGKDSKNTDGAGLSRGTQGQQGRPRQGGAAVGEGTGGGTNQRSTNGKNTGNSNSTKVHVQQRSTLSKGKPGGMDSALVCQRNLVGPQPLVVGCCPTVTYCCYPAQCIP
ncbi:uncharacterized protein LOC126556983 [Anopheles maculipalpis]|uniref:uncharacterized protein LOC126556983 n=1 Tax=Anopheles maculipalpis TaxID=1496333 RepID=UPI002159080B|nr:uncharacterized protein LOC126556983 [Anopheles maculipalpis]